MATTTEIPVQIHPEAAARVAELGMEKELQLMLEHTRQTVPGLESIEVETYESEGDEERPHICIVGLRPGVCASPDDYRPKDEWNAWFVRTFPPEVLWWFLFSLEYRGENGR